MQPGMVECPSDGCDYLFFREDENQSYHACPMCGIEYCLRCDMVYHVEYTCDEVQEDKRQRALQAAVDRINNQELPEDR